MHTQVGTIVDTVRDYVVAEALRLQSANRSNRWFERRAGGLKASRRQSSSSSVRAAPFLAVRSSR
jgi:hypothetical protein